MASFTTMLSNIWICRSNHTIPNLWLVSTHPGLNFNAGLHKPQVESDHGLAIASLNINGCHYLSLWQSQLKPLSKRAPVSLVTSWFNMKMWSYQYRKSHCGDKTILRPPYLHNGISFTGKMISFYWIRAKMWGASSPAVTHQNTPLVRAISDSTKSMATVTKTKNQIKTLLILAAMRTLNHWGTMLPCYRMNYKGLLKNSKLENWKTGHWQRMGNSLMPRAFCFP